MEQFTDTINGKVYVFTPHDDGSVLIRIGGGGAQLALERVNDQEVRISLAAYDTDENVGELMLTIDAEVLTTWIHRVLHR